MRVLLSSHEGKNPLASSPFCVQTPVHSTANPHRLVLDDVHKMWVSWGGVFVIRLESKKVRSLVGLCILHKANSISPRYM